MKRLLPVLMLVAACETRAAAPASGFVHLSELDGDAAQCIAAVLGDLPVETEGQPRLDYMPTTLDDARRLIETWHGDDVAKFQEACDTPAWLILSQTAPGDEARFKRGWAIEKTSLEIYPFSLNR